MSAANPITPITPAAPAAPTQAVGAAAGIAPRRFERQQTIRFSHCDPAGIVFFPQYFVMFNHLVEDWFTEGLGLPYAHLIGTRRIGLPTVSLQTDFRTISRMGEVITLGLQVTRLGRSSLHLSLDARLPDDPAALVMAGEVSGQLHGTVPAQIRVQLQQVLVSTDLGTHRAVPLPDDVRAAILAFQDPARQAH